MNASLHRLLCVCLAASVFGGCADLGIGAHSREAILWATGSAEYAAVTLQTYALAREKLDVALADSTWSACLEQAAGFEGLPPAIVIDLDETVLDNRVFQTRLLREGLEFDVEMWNAWVNESRVEAIPGAVEFLQYAHGRGIEVFYITNREHAVEKVTRANLVALELPLNPEIDTLLTKHERPDWGSDKESRRRLVAESHRVLLIIGDHLGDFVPVKSATREGRRGTTFEYAKMWGEKWFMLPNPIYGSWVKAPSDEDPSE